MIIEMSRVIVLGPKRLLGPVIEEVQRLGLLHIDRIESEEAPALSPMRLEGEEAQQVQTLERALTRVEGLLSLLPAVPVGAIASAAAVVTVPVEELDAQVAGIEGRVRELTRRKLELEEERTLIASYESAVRVLSPLLSALSGSKSFETVGFMLNTKDHTVVAALRNELVKLTEGRVELVSRDVDERRIGVVVAFRRANSEHVRGVLARAGVIELRLPSRFVREDPMDTIALMERRKAEIPGETASLDAELTSIARAERPRLLAIRPWLADQLAQMKVVPDLTQSRYTFIVHGWAPTRALGQIRGALGTTFGRDLVIYDTPADPHEAERVPVLLDNHPWIRPFQRLLALFQPPRYGAWDPSPVMAITFPVFVGLVIGDVAYGLLIFWLGWMFRKLSVAGKTLAINFLNVRFPPHLLSDLSFLLRVSAFWIIIFGVVYLEFFGNLPELLAHKYHLSIQPIFNRVAEANQMRYFLLIIASGILMIFLGLMVHFIQAVRHRHSVSLFESTVITLGTAGLLLFLGARGEILPDALGPIGLYLLLSAVAVAGISLLVERDVIKRFLWLLESTSAFGHILSHARLMAFGLAAAALASAANEVGPAMSAQFGIPGLVGRIAGWLLAAVFQTMFFAFTIMGHVIQPARLHWVEFFTKFKFHEETGRRYQPFQKSAAEGRK